MLIAKKPLKNRTNGKKNKGSKQRVLLQIIYSPATWLIDFYQSFIYGFIDDENEETLK